MHGEIFRAFIKGRQHINNKKYAERDADRTVILAAWDRIIAANALRYANTIKTKLATPGSYNGPWTEMKGFIDMIQYNGTNKLGTAGYNTVKALVGSKPADVDAAKLDQIISTLKTTYGF
jgi:hypothetical protein